MKKVFVLLCIGLNVLAYADKDTSSIAIKYGNTIKEEDLSKHLYILASDEYEGRETGMKGQKMAAEYISKHFSAIGIDALKDSDITEGYYQKIPLKIQEIKSSKISIRGFEYEFLKDYYFFCWLRRYKNRSSRDRICLLYQCVCDNLRVLR